MAYLNFFQLLLCSRYFKCIARLARRHTHTHAQRCPIVFFLQRLCAQLRQKISSIILSCHTFIQHKTPPHSFSLLELQFMLRDMKAAFTLSRSVEDGTQTQEINPRWQSVIHHFHHFSCGRKEKKTGEKKEKALYSLHFDKQAHSHFLCHRW